MANPECIKPHEFAPPSAAANPVSSAASESGRIAKDDWANTAAANSDAIAPDDTDDGLTQNAFLAKQVARAECLLGYAAEAGIEIDDTTRSAVLTGVRATQQGWTQHTANDILVAVTKLAAKVRPVTAESLTASSASGSAKRQIRMYSKVIWLLGLVLVPFSIANFCVSKLNDTIQSDLHAAQDLAVKLSTELYRPTAQDDVTVRAPIKEFSLGVTQTTVIQDLTQFAIAIRATSSHAQKLNWFIGNVETPPFANPHTRRADRSPLELSPGLEQFVKEQKDSIQVYQKIRYFAQSVQTDASIFYGALLNCILPMLYAILGTLAYLLRTFEQQLKQRTFTVVDGHAARFAIAAIGGFVVGLFNLTIAPDNTAATQTATISPLAIAFMVGYAADVFFSFLEGLIHTFGRTRSDPASSPPA